MTVFVFDLVSRQRDFLRTEQVHRNRGLIEGMAHHATGSMLAGDVGALQEIINGFVSYPELQYAMVTDPGGRIMAHSDRHLVGSFLRDPLSRRVLEGPAQPATLVDTSQALDMMAPIQWDKHTIGWVRLSTGMAESQAGVREVARSGLLYAIGAIAMGVLMAYWMARRMTRRLDDLLEVADATAAGQRDRRAATNVLDGEDELSRVENSFNAMLDALRDRERALEHVNAELEQRVAERTAALQESEGALRAVLEHANDAFIMMDAEGCVLEWNRKAQETFGWSREEVLGRGLAEFIIPESLRGAHRAGLAHFHQTGEGKVVDRRVEVQGQTREGRLIPVELSVGVRKRGAAVFFDAFLHDISEREQARAHLVESHQRVEEALREKETLLKEVYHRVKNNLQVIQSLLTLQRRAVVDDAARSAIDDSAQRVRAMALVHEKLYQSGNLSVVSLPDYTRDLLLQIGDASGAKQRGLTLHADIESIDTGLDSAVPFGLLLTELVTNSLKHAFPERSGDVWVSVQACETGGMLLVKDNGAGFKEGVDLLKSTSMGLKLAGSLTKQLGGELKWQNLPEGGVLFEAHLARL